MAQPANNDSSASGWLDIATLMALATALVYAAGWTYAYHYFANFQLGLLTLDIPTEYYFMYGFWVFRTWWWLALVYIVLALLLPWLLTTAWGKTWLVPYWNVAKRLLPVTALLLFLGVWQMGMVTADRHYQQQREADFPGYPQTRVWLKLVNPEEEGLKTLAASLPQGCYRLLLQNADKLFLFQAPAHQPPARLAAVEVSLGEVAALRVLPHYSSCGG